MLSLVTDRTNIVYGIRINIYSGIILETQFNSFTRK